MMGTLTWGTCRPRPNAIILNHAAKRYSRVICHQPLCFDSWVGRAPWAGLIIIFWAVHSIRQAVAALLNLELILADWENCSFACRFVKSLS